MLDKGWGKKVCTNPSRTKDRGEEAKILSTSPAAGEGDPGGGKRVHASSPRGKFADKRTSPGGRTTTSSRTHKNSARVAEERGKKRLFYFDKEDAPLGTGSPGKTPVAERTSGWPSSAKKGAFGSVWGEKECLGFELPSPDEGTGGDEEKLAEKKIAALTQHCQTVPEPKKRGEREGTIRRLLGSSDAIKGRR